MIINRLIANNLIAIVIHLCICLIFLLPIALFIHPGHLWTEAGIERMGLIGVFTQLSIIGVYTIIIFLLYVWAGRKFLIESYEPEHILTDIFSVMSVTCIMVLAERIIAANLDNDLSMFSLLLTPNALISGTISFFFHFELGSVHIVLSLLPFLALFMGLRARN